MERKEINNINEIVGEILDYQIINDKIIIYTKKCKYFLNYSYDNENKVFDVYNDYCNKELEELINQQEKNCSDRKTFRGLLIFDLLTLLMIIFGNFPLMLVICILPVVFGVQFINILKILKQENKDLNLKKKNVLDNFYNKECMLMENEKKHFMEMTEDELLTSAVNEIIENVLESEIVELDDDYIDYDFLNKIDLDDLNEECFDEMLNLFLDDTEKQQKVKTLNFNKK